MKNVRTWAVVAVLGLVTMQSYSQKKRNNVTYLVSNIHCQDCVNKIQKNIAFEKGITDLIPNLKEKTIQVSFNNQKTDTTKIKTAFAHLGYEVKTIKFD